MEHLFLQAPGAAVAVPGVPWPLRADMACPSLSCLENASAVVTVWGGGPAPAWVLLGLALQVAFPWAGSVPCSGDLATAGRDLVPWYRPLLAKAGQGLSCGVGTGSGKSPCLCPCPLLAAGVCFRLGQAWGGEPAPAGRTHTATGSSFATEERGETAETALALVSPPPAHSCPIRQGPRCPSQASQHHSCPRSPAALGLWLGWDSGEVAVLIPMGCGAGAVGRRVTQLRCPVELPGPLWGGEGSGTLLGVGSQVP